MTENPLKRLSVRLDSETRQPKIVKANRTLHLNDQNFRHLQQYCKSRGTTVSDVIDRLIEMYLAEVSQPAAVPDKDKAGNE